MEKCKYKLWGGRYTDEADSYLCQINNSLPVDKRLFNEDIDGSIAYAECLKNSKILNDSDFFSIKKALENIRKEWIDGTLIFLPEDEDVHTVNERRLCEIIGIDIGGKLHTGRSRNEQIVVDMKLWMKKSAGIVMTSLESLVQIINEKARHNLDILMPGYTHLQKAQPVRFSHWILSYAHTFLSDTDRLQDLIERVDVLPLGSGAISGNPFDIDRHFLAKSLGFSKISLNSMNVVSDRDFVIEFNFIGTLIAIHLSRLAEDLIIYSSAEFGFIELPERFTTGSSLMPQKRNPDSLELIRSLSGTIFGQHCGFLMTMKGLPSTYNKDFQGDKLSMFTVFDQIQLGLNLMREIMAKIVVNKDKCYAALSFNMLATDLAYYLVRKGVSFREAHHIAGSIVSYSETNSIAIEKIPIQILKEKSKYFEDDIKDIWNFENSVEQYKVIGGTSKKSVLEQIATIDQAFEEKKLKK